MKAGTEAKFKFGHLMRLLGLRRWQAMGLLEAVWRFTGENAMRGDVGRFTNEEIAIGIDYDGDADAMVAALVKSKWLDEDPEFRLVVHDWTDHWQDYIRLRCERAKLVPVTDIIRARTKPIPTDRPTTSDHTSDNVRPPTPTSTPIPSLPTPSPDTDTVAALRADPFKTPKAQAEQIVSQYGAGAVKVAMHRAKDGKKPRGLLIHLLREGIDPEDIPKPEPPPLAFPSPEDKRRALAAFRELHPGYKSVPAATVVSLPNFRAWYESQNGVPA